MQRRNFLRISLLSGLWAWSGGEWLISASVAGKQPRFPRYRGFNLLAKFSPRGPRKKFNEEDFEIMAEWGFDFARIPMSYWTWASPSDWYKIDEQVLKDIDEVVELGRQYGVHINLNMHRVPGYCINGRDLEPVDLFEDSPENMQKALDALIYYWRLFAQRYKGISSEQLSFDLINEPPKMKDHSRYIEIVTALVKAIREEDPQRLIVADGMDIGRTPVPGIAHLGVVQSTRGYDPMSVSHYKATWVPEDQFESSGPPSWPLKADDGTLWNKETIRKKLIDRWKALQEKGVSVHVGEWGCYNKTPHNIALAWMEDMLSLFKETGWGHALWNLKGNFGVLDSNRPDVKYENYRGHKLDRKMLELLRKY